MILPGVANDFFSLIVTIILQILGIPAQTKDVDLEGHNDVKYGAHISHPRLLRELHQETAQGKGDPHLSENVLMYATTTGSSTCGR